MKIQLIALLMTLGFASACGSSGGKKDKSPETSPPSVVIASELALNGQGTFEELLVGRPVQVTVKGKNEKGELVEMEADSWKVEPASLATIDGKGLLTPQKEGEGNLIAKVDQKELTARIRIKTPAVGPVLQEIKITSEPTGELVVGQTVQLKAEGLFNDSSSKALTEVNWVVEEPNATEATITATGVFKAKKSGTASVVARVGEVKSQPLTLTVKDVPGPVRLTGLTMEADSTTIEVNTDGKFTVKASYSDGTVKRATEALVFSFAPGSIAADIAPVGEGVYRFKSTKVGTATFTAEVSGVVVSNALTFTVNDRPAPTLDKLTLNPDAKELVAGAQTTLTVEGLYSDNTTKAMSGNVTFDVKPNPETVKIEPAGNSYRLVASKEGVVTIVASVGNVSAPAVTITIKPAVVTELTVKADATELLVSGIARINVEAKYSDGTVKAVTEAPKFTIAPEAIVTIQAGTDGTHLVTAVKEGTANVTVSYAGVDAKPLSFVVKAKPEGTLVILLSDQNTLAKKLKVYEEVGLKAFWKSAGGLTAAENITWRVTPGSGAIGTILPSGKARALQAGVFTVEASIGGGLPPAALEITVEGGADYKKLEFWVYSGKPDNTKFPWKNPGGTDFVYGPESDKVSSSALSCAVKSLEGLKKFLAKEDAILKEIFELNGIDDFRVIVNVVKTRNDLSVLSNLDRSTYFWHWNVKEGQVPVLSMSNFETGSWVWEVQTTVAGTGCLQPDENEARRYLEYALQRLTVKDNYDVPVRTPQSPR